jgi:hypothetical protein
MSVVSQFMHDLKGRHIEAIDHVMKYLKATSRRWLLIKRGWSLTIEAYTDADYPCSLSDGTTTLGYYIVLCGNLVAWRSKKQSIVARLNIKAEFRDMTMEIYELLWMKLVLD